MKKLKENDSPNTYSHVIGETQRAARKRHAVDVDIDGLLHPLASDEIERVPNGLLGRQLLPLGRRARNIILAGDWVSAPGRTGEKEREEKTLYRMKSNEKIENVVQGRIKRNIAVLNTAILSALRRALPTPPFDAGLAPLY